MIRKMADIGVKIDCSFTVKLYDEHRYEKLDIANVEKRGDARRFSRNLRIVHGEIIASLRS